MPASASSSLSKAPWATPAKKEEEHAVMGLRAEMLSMRDALHADGADLHPGACMSTLQAQAALRMATHRAVQQKDCG